MPMTWASEPFSSATVAKVPCFTIIAFATIFAVLLFIFLIFLLLINFLSFEIARPCSLKTSCCRPRSLCLDLGFLALFSRGVLALSAFRGLPLKDPYYLRPRLQLEWSTLEELVLPPFPQTHQLGPRLHLPLLLAPWAAPYATSYVQV